MYSQCLYGVPELRDALQTYAPSPAAAPSGSEAQSHRLTVATKNLFSNLDRSAVPVVPGSFLQVLREKYPQFAEVGRTGQYSQQDAEECWVQLMYSLRERIKVCQISAKPLQPLPSPHAIILSIFDELFSINW